MRRVRTERERNKHMHALLKVEKYRFYIKIVCELFSFRLARRSFCLYILKMREWERAHRTNFPFEFRIYTKCIREPNNEQRTTKVLITRIKWNCVYCHFVDGYNVLTRKAMRNKILPLAEKTERTKEWVSHRTRTYCTTSHSHCSTESIIKKNNTHTHTERSEKEHKHATVLFHLDKRNFFFQLMESQKTRPFQCEKKESKQNNCIFN